MNEIDPKDDFETIVLMLVDGKLSVDEFLPLLAKADLVIPSRREPDLSGNNFEPLLYTKNNVTYLSTYSNIKRAGLIADLAPYCITMNGLLALKRLPINHGLCVNVGYQASFEIAPYGVEDIIAKVSGRPH